MVKEQKGKRRLWYEDGKKTTCDYNRYNDYFLMLCLYNFKDFIIYNSEAIKHLVIYFINTCLYLLVILTAPISIPLLVLANKRRLFEQYGDDIKLKIKK